MEHLQLVGTKDALGEALAVPRDGGLDAAHVAQIGADTVDQGAAGA